ncbi:hypothetical protein EB093_09715, partial [bacterium]|nr:hypothetical protein [bacterium]
QAEINHARQSANQDCSIPPTGLGYTAWEDWDPLLPEHGQLLSHKMAINSLADQDPRQAFCNQCATGDVVENFTSSIFDWMNSKTSSPQNADANIFDSKNPIIPEDPVTKNINTKPVFAYPGLDEEGKRETLPGSLPIPADFPANNRFNQDDAQQRQSTIDNANKILDKLNKLRNQLQNNPVPTTPLPPSASNLPRSGFVDLPSVDAKKANKFVPSPEPINQSMGPNPSNQRNFPDAIPNAKYTELSNARDIGYGKANKILTQPPGGPACRFINTPQCSPDYPYYTGANIGVEGGAQMFRCNGPDDGEQAEAVASIESGEIKKAFIVNGGKGYTMAPKVTILGGGGDGAILETRINPTTGVVVEISVKDGGFGYHSTPTLQLETPGMSNQCYLCCAGK